MQRPMLMTPTQSYLCTFLVALTFWISQHYISSNAPVAKSLPPSTIRKMLILSCVDGDTCTARDNMGIISTLRLTGIDAPETFKSKRCPGQAFAEDSTKLLQNLVVGKSLKVIINSSDRYGRYLATLIEPAKGFSINEKMIELGAAFAYRRPYQKQAQDRWAERVERIARKNKKGLWSLKQRPQAPWLYRKNALNCLQR